MTTSVDASRWSASRTASIAGPLTTVFTPPFDCSAIHAITSVLTSTNTANLGGWFRPGVVAYMPSEAWASGWKDQPSVSNTCYPSGVATRQISAFYSPGVYCPHGWTSAMTMLNSEIRTESSITFTPSNYAQSSQASVLLRSLLPNETMVLCCPGKPSNFKINPTDFLCRGYFAGTPTATLYGYGAGSTDVVSDGSTTRSYSVEPTLHTIPLVPTETSSNFTISIPFQSTPHEGYGAVTATLSVYPVQIRWQASDTSPDGGPAATTDTGSAITSANPNTTESAASITATQGGLTSGSIAGIAVGCIAAVSLVGLAFFILLRRRNRRRNGGLLDDNKEPPPPELDAAGQTPGYTRSELASPELKGAGLWEKNGFEAIGLVEAPETERMELDGAARVPGVFELGDNPVLATAR